MKPFIALSAFVAFFNAAWTQAAPRAACSQDNAYTLLIHTGAGLISAADWEARKTLIADVLRAGHRMLADGKPALDVVQASIQTLEDSGLVDAGKGGIANQAGFVELDASLMDGSGRQAGAVAAVQQVKNPIAAARCVMDKSQHVLIVGDGADRFARNVCALTPVPQSYFPATHHRHASRDLPRRRDAAHREHGTVGAVALDRCGHLAAGTSTGGWDEKIPGRVGDSPIVGAGTFASDDLCAVSSTGHGEYFLRWAVAHDISARIQYLHESVDQAASATISHLKTVGGEGGVIVLDRQGHMAWPFNSDAMGRGYVGSDGQIHLGQGAELEPHS